MPSVVDICNTALAHVGADSQIASISPPDGTVEAGYCARFYPIARRLLIDRFAFRFTRTRVLLAEVTNPSDEWGFAYALPADCVRPVQVLPAVGTSALWFSDGYDDAQNLDGSVERDSALFAVEGDVLLTNEPDAVLLYRRDVVDPNRFSPGFADALAKTLAGYLAPSLIKGIDGARIGATWAEAGTASARAAATDDANTGAESNEFNPSSVRARA